METEIVKIVIKIQLQITASRVPQKEPKFGHHPQCFHKPCVENSSAQGLPAPRVHQIRNLIKIIIWEFHKLRGTFWGVRIMAGLNCLCLL